VINQIVDLDQAAASRLEIERRLLATDATAEAAPSMASQDGARLRMPRPRAMRRRGRSGIPI
jgi:hypothetical protein